MSLVCIYTSLQLLLVITTRVTLLTQNLNVLNFKTESPRLIYSLNTFLIWVGQAFLFFFDCGPTTFYATEEGTASTRIQSNWSSLKICVYLQASLQKFSKTVKKTQTNKIKQQNFRIQGLFFISASSTFSCLPV